MEYSSKSHCILSKIHGSRRSYAMLASLTKFEKSEIAAERLKMIQFFEKYGEKATVDPWLVSYPEAKIGKLHV